MVFKKFILILIPILLLFTFLFFTDQVNLVQANVLHFEDDFNDNDVSDWSTSQNGQCSFSTTWETKDFGGNNYAYGTRIEDHGCRMFTKSSAQHINSEQNFVFEIDVYIPHTLNNDVNIIFKYKDPSNLMGFYSIGNQRTLYKIVNGNYQALGNYNISLVPNTWHKIKIVKISNSHEFYLDNNIFGTYEESAPFIEEFGVGFRMGNGANPFSEVWFDNVKVTLLDNEESGQLEITDYKQFIGGWENDEYDNAEEWSSNSTMSRWGCAVTSAAMVLDFYGHDVDPGNLNDWLKNEVDGYARNGALMWPAVTRYTRDESEASTLEFSYLDYSDNALSDEIDQGRPPIIKLENEDYGGNHFIVGKGLSENDDDFTINDPGSGSNPNLSDANNYWGDSLRIGRFRETETDLSYIVAMLTDNFDLGLKKDNIDVGDEYYQEEKPFLNPDDPSSSQEGETLKSVWYPKPENGNYSFEVSGNGFYQLDIYYYDENANVKMETIYGYLSQEGTDTYEFQYDDGDINSINAHSAAQSLLENLNYICSIGDIERRGLCQSIMVLTENSLKLGEENNIFTATVLLDLVKSRILFNTPQNIDYELSTYLLAKINQIAELL